MGDISNRATLARWKWKAEKARADLTADFSVHGHQLAGEWCDFDESTSLSDGSERLGSSPDRFIQRWQTRQAFTSAFRSCGSPGRGMEHVYVLIMDRPDAAWIRVHSDIISSALAPAAGEWLMDGFIAFNPESESLLSVDVEEKFGAHFIETTLIGNGFRELRKCFSRHGPLRLEIAGESHNSNLD